MSIVKEAVAAGEVLWFLNSLVVIRVSSAQGADAMCVMEHRLPYGDSPPLHVHRDEDEIFHILEGVVRFRVDGEERLAVAGETVLAPKRLPHTYRVESLTGARCLTVTRGSGFETMVRAAGRPATAAELPAQVTPTPKMVAELARACAENGIDIIGPPLG